MASKPPRTKMSRLAHLGGLTSRVSSSYLGQRIKGAFQDEETRADALKKLHLENAERVVSTMGALKGAAMKVGQGLAQAVSSLDLPPEVAGILGRLNDSAEPVPFDLIRTSVEHELEGSLSSLFAAFDEEPLGTASLAQAHAARLPDGTPVVVKVLHEGIDDSVDADLAALKTILLTGRVLRREREEVESIFAEIRDRLREELDYYQEAANLEQFKRALAPLEGVHVPGTHPKYCTGRVLTMDRLTGRPLEAFLQDSSPEARQRAGTLLVTGFHHMFYKLRALHADPHPGNYLFRPDGGVGIIDFGCVKRFELDWVADYARMAQTIVDNRKPDFLALARKLDVMLPGTGESEDVLWTFARTICGPLTVPHYRCGVDLDDVLQQVKRQVPGVLRHPNLRSPRELVYLHRSLGGIYSMLRQLGHEYDYGRLFREHTDHAIAVAEWRKPDIGLLPLA